MVFFYKVIRDIDYYYLYLKVEKVIKRKDGISRVRLFRSLIRDHYWKRGEVTLNSDVDFQVRVSSINSMHIFSELTYLLLNETEPWVFLCHCAVH